LDDRLELGSAIAFGTAVEELAGKRGLQRMTTSLGIPPCYTDGGAFARRHGKADFPSGFEGFMAMDAGTDLVRFPRVVRGFVVEELDVFQVVGLEGQGTCAYGFTDVASKGGQRLGW